LVKFLWLLGFPLAALSTYSITKTIQRLMQPQISREEETIPKQVLMIGDGLVVSLILCIGTVSLIQGKSQPRYFFPLVPFLVLIATKALGQLDFKLRDLCVTAPLFVMASGIFFLPLRFEEPHGLLTTTRTLYEFVVFLILLMSSLGISYLSSKSKEGYSCWSRLKGRLPTVFLSMVLAFNLVSTCSQVADGYLFDFNDIGIKEAGHYIGRHTTPEDLLVSEKNVAYYANRSFYSWSTIINENIDLYDLIERDSRIRYVAIGTYSGVWASIYGEQLEQASSSLELECRIGSYFLYRVESNSKHSNLKP